MANRCGCRGGSSNCSCLIIAGDNATVTGSGSSSDPYVVAAAGGGGGGGFYFVMTDAEFFDAVAASALIPGSFILYTEGPTIGTVGNTSATRILVQAITTSTVTTDVTVYQDFDAGGWRGVYDIVGDTGIGFSELRDHRNNVVIDVINSNLVLTQFPWGYDTVYGNRVTQDHMTGTVLAITGWGDAAAAGTVIADNTVTAVGGVFADETIVDLSGLVGTGQKFMHNEIVASQLRITATLPNNAVFIGNEVTGGFRALFAPTTCPSLAVKNNVFDGHNGNQDDLKFQATSTDLTITGCRLQGAATSTQYTLNGAGGGITLISSTFQDQATVFRTSTSTADVSFEATRVLNGGVQADGMSNPIEFAACDLVGVSFILDPASEGGITVVRSSCYDVAFSQSSITTYPLSIFDSIVNGVSIDQSGTEGGLTLDNSRVSGGNLETSGENEIRLLNCASNDSTISQQRTNGPNRDDVVNSLFSGCSVTLTGSGGPTGAVMIDTVSVTSGGALTINDASMTTPSVQKVEVTTAALLAVQSGGRVRNSRIAGGGTLNTGAFSHIGLVVEKSTTTTLTANNTDTYAGFGVTTLI